MTASLRAQARCAKRLVPFLRVHSSVFPQREKNLHKKLTPLFRQFVEATFFRAFLLYYQVTEAIFSIILSSKFEGISFRALLACSALLSSY